ncbi:YheC/YheD family endospore coat-associated protein [Numidum massiliense]|uniref:YheC/YheD family endospore coat-associated protein n=1 Tax=Numidum massiliense TaxID=1522315 RepID=UPI0006D57413|nr:YheC/YheD family protein [Numidum massiliense]
MNSYVCRLHRLRSAPTKAVVMTPAIMRKLGCTAGSSVRLCCGNKELITRIASIKGKKEEVIYLPASVAAELSLPPISAARVIFHNRTLRLGPVIGILTTGFTGSPLKPFGARTSLFKQFLVAGLADGPIFFVFTPAMVDWQNETVTGWFIHYHPAHKQYVWRAERTPLPDVVYDRVPNRKQEMEPSVVACKERLLNHRHNIRWFNQGFFNKWHIHEQLYNHPVASQYIPETIHSPRVKELQEMLNRHQMLYLKPSSGSLGLGIIRITQQAKGSYYCRYHSLQRNVLKRFTSLDKLVRYFFSQQATRMDRYIAQQGIRLIRHENRAVDFRLHMHKNACNEWKLAGTAAKVAGTGSVTTHVRTGGSVIPAHELFRMHYGSSGPQLQKKLEQAAVAIAQALEGTTPGLLGELGMDMGIDTHQRVWLFEVNAKPGRHIFYHPDLRSAGRQSARFITEYSLKLAEFI